MRIEPRFIVQGRILDFNVSSLEEVVKLYRLGRTKRYSLVEDRITRNVLYVDEVFTMLRKSRWTYAQVRNCATAALLMVFVTLAMRYGG
jgi:hypothetical protein